MASKEAADNVGYYSPSGSEGTAIQGTSNNEMTTMHEEKVEMPGVENMSNVDASGLKRDLHLRHMVMIAISGTIGTRLFLTSGKTIATAGPLGALLAYMLIGCWLVFVCQAIGEIATLLPLPGAFTAWGARVFDEAFSFQMTWVYFTNWALTIPAELSA